MNKNKIFDWNKYTEKILSKIEQLQKETIYIVADRRTGKTIWVNEMLNKVEKSMVIYPFFNQKQQYPPNKSIHISNITAGLTGQMLDVIFFDGFNSVDLDVIQNITLYARIIVVISVN